MSALARTLAWISLAPLLVCGVVHVCSLLGFQPPAIIASGLKLGVFIVLAPAMIISGRISRGAKRTDYLRAALRGCPSWMRIALAIAMAYTVVNFLLCLFAGPDSERVLLRLLSSFWMFMYFGGFAMLWSAARLGDAAIPKCPEGHECSPFAEYCEACGVKLRPQVTA